MFDWFFSVAVTCFSPSLDSVLLIQRGRQPMKDYWALPGGKVEYGETMKEAARREVSVIDN